MITMLKLVSTRILMAEPAGDNGLIQSSATNGGSFGEPGAELDVLSHRDPLTGLVNREVFFDRLRQAILRSSRVRSRVAILLFGLEDFKQMSDVDGRGVGDALLGIVAERLQAQVREYDTVARLEGDKFVVMLADLGQDLEIYSLIDRTTRKVSEPVEVHGQTLRPSASVGWSLFPLDSLDPEGLLKIAEVALEDDKHRRARAHEENETLPPLDRQDQVIL